MTWEIRPAVREDVGLFVGFAGEEGSGKTYTMLEIATGIARYFGGPSGRVAVIDTENRRALHYADKEKFDFPFDHVPFEAPYTSERYAEAVEFVYKKGYKAIVLDSASHEHDGIGGYLDRGHGDLAKRVDRYMKKYPNSDEYAVIDKLTPSSWIEPKAARRRMRQQLLACSTTVPILFGFRAEEKVFASKDGKLVAHNPPLWTPICGKGMPFEMTAFFLMHQDNPGVIAKALKLQDQHKDLFPMGKLLTRESGARIAEWARGAKATANAPAGGAPATPQPSSEGLLSADQVIDLETRCNDNGVSLDKLRGNLQVERLSQAKAGDYARALAWIERVLEARSKK